ncbi:MAG TPA: RidA family protein [Thermodesulfobacteriota bacterium]|jgi:enamine deaminase RidA (YjgF/YER057c/UK114 family)|nr:RidA family protein [Thermodesulfobacteriota bacterium]
MLPSRSKEETIKAEQRLRELGIEILQTPAPLGSYKPAVISGDLIFISGQLPIKEGRLLYKGKVGAEVSVEEGMDAARMAAINAISIMKGELGDLDRVRRIVKVTGYVSSASGFDMQASVVNGASDLFYQVFGEEGRHARVAVGVYELPLGSPVEIEVIAEIFLLKI